MTSAVRNIGVQPGPQTDFTLSDADVTLFGGSAFGGKTTSLVLEGMKLSVNPRNHGFRGAILRRTLSDIKKAGSLLDACNDFYLLDPQCQGRSSPLDFTWAHLNSRIELAGLDTEADKFKFQGTQLWWLGFDEVTHFSSSQFHYLRTRVRGGGGKFRPYVSATCNPQSKGWVRELVDWYIQADGYPDPKKAGIKRWMVRNQDDKLISFGSAVEAQVYLNSIKDPQQVPWTFRFIPALANDNKIGMALDPNYVASLSSADRVTRRQLLDGNWDSVKKGDYFDFNWLDKWEGTLNDADIKCSVRGWDIAYSHDGDWTVGVLLTLLKNGKIIIRDIQRFRLGPGQLDQKIYSIAKSDGHRVVQALFQDPAAGKFVADSLMKGIKAASPATRVDILPATKSKGDYFSLFSAAIDPSAKNNVKQAYYMDCVALPEFRSELEAWTGSEVAGENNDCVDATSRAWLYLKQFGFRAGWSGFSDANR